MGGRQYRKEDVRQIDALIGEGLTDREIAQKLGRSEAGVRNLRYRKRLVRKAEDESKALLLQRDKLRDEVKDLQDRQQILSKEVKSLEERKNNLELIINMDKILLQNTLSQSLMNLKSQRPDLFTLSPQQLITYLIVEIMKKV